MLVTRIADKSELTLNTTTQNRPQGRKAHTACGVHSAPEAPKKSSRENFDPMRIATSNLLALALLAFIATAVGCGESESGPSSDPDQIQEYLDNNPEAANADMDPPPDPQM